MALWFRFYSDAMRHPKVAKLTDAEFRLWVELLAVAADHDGFIPPINDLKHVLKRRLDHLSRGLEGLLRASLIDPLEAGYEPHGWSKRQYKSDTSTERVQKHRQKRNVSVTPPETEPEPEPDTETEADIPAAKATGRARAPSCAMPDDVSVQTWQDFESYRRAQKAPISETVISAFRQQAEKAGWTLESALVESVARGWRGFKAEWVKSDGGSQNIRAGGNAGPDKRSGIAKACDGLIVGEFR